MAKTDWQMGDTVLPDDLNQIGQEINQNRDNLAAHTAATTGVHGATSAATPNTLVQRDSAGRFKAAAPAAADDVARKAEVDERAPLSGAVFTGPVEYSSNPRESNDLNNEINPGWVVFTPNTANRPDASGFTNYGVVRIERRNTNRVAQTAYGLTGNMNAQIATRVLGENGWSPWYKVWNESNDGAGSGLDADLFDGLQSDRFIFGDNQNGSIAHSGDMNSVAKSGFYSAASSTSNQPPGVSGGLFVHVQHPSSSTNGIQLFQTGSSRLFFRRQLNGSWNNWYELLHSGNLPYETGTWTPELRFTISSSGIAYSLRTGRYTRIGNLVNFTFRIALSSKGSANGDAYITGLPFTSLGGSEHAAFSIGLFSGITMPAKAYWVYGIIFNNSNQILIRPSGDIASNIGLSASSFKDDTDIRAEGFYFIAA